MAYTNLLDFGPNGIFSGITSTRGDLLVCDGEKNVRLPASPVDGHVLTVSSSSALGLQWAAAAGGSGSGQLSGAYYTTGIFQVTSMASPFVGSALYTLTAAASGTNLIVLAVEVQTDRLLSNPQQNRFFVQVYKNGTFLPDSTVAYSALPGLLSSYTFLYSTTCVIGDQLEVYMFSPFLSLFSPHSSVVVLSLAGSSMPPPVVTAGNLIQSTPMSFTLPAAEPSVASFTAFGGTNVLLFNFEAETDRLLSSAAAGLNDFTVQVHKNGTALSDSLTTFSALPGVFGSYLFLYSSVCTSGDALNITLSSPTITTISPRSTALCIDAVTSQTSYSNDATPFQLTTLGAVQFGITDPLASAPAFSGANLVLLTFEARCDGGVNGFPGQGLNRFSAQLYRNGVAQADSLRTYSVIPSILTSYSFVYSGTFTASDQLDVFVSSPTVPVISVARTSLAVLNIASTSARLSDTFSFVGTDPAQIVSITTPPGSGTYIALVSGSAVSREATECVFTLSRSATTIQSSNVSILPDIVTPISMATCFMVSSSEAVTVSVAGLEAMSTADILNFQIEVFAMS